MFQQDNHRKFSLQQAYENQENPSNSSMFPRSDQFSPEETLELLKLKFNPQQHQHILINYCYRCHKTRLVEFFRQFKTHRLQNLKQPNISNFYSNACFIDLYLLGRFLEGKESQYPSISMGKPSKNLQVLMDSLFLQQGYIPHFQRFLLFYPEYLQKHLTLEKTLFEDSRIDNKIAYFLGILACAELGCVYGIKRMLNKFRRVGGDQEWIREGKYPSKIRHLLTLNKKLARSNWQIDSETIQQLVEGSSWTVNELAIIIQIFTFSHQISTIALAIGLNCEESHDPTLDLESLFKIKEQYDSIYCESGQSQRLASVIENISKVSSDEETQKTQKNQKLQKKKEMLQKLKSQKILQGNRKSLKKSLRRSDNQELIENYMKEINNELTKQEIYFRMHKLLKKILPTYQIVQKRSDKDFPPRDSSDTNFKYTAFPLLYNLTTNAAQQALDLINYSEIMTSNNFGQAKINDTKSFRKAMRYYSENLCGYFHFEYNYKLISQLLTMPLKFYIRLLTLSPVHINKQVVSEINHQEGQFNLFDLGHVAILTASMTFFHKQIAKWVCAQRKQCIPSSFDKISYYLNAQRLFKSLITIQQL